MRARPVLVERWSTGTLFVVGLVFGFLWSRLAGREPAHGANGWYSDDDEAGENGPGCADAKDEVCADQGGDGAGGGEGDRPGAVGADQTEGVDSGLGVSTPVRS